MNYKVDEIVSTIKQLPRKGSTLLIAIDGRGGAGKSTLALLIKQKIPEITIITMDDFYNEEKKVIEWRELEKQVLEPLNHNKEAKYMEFKGRDNSRELRTVSPGGIIIIEGCNSIRKAISDVYDYKIWVEVSLEGANKRVSVRDHYDDENWSKFHRPNENSYIQEESPQERADLVIENDDFKEDISDIDKLWRSVGG